MTKRNKRPRFLKVYRDRHGKTCIFFRRPDVPLVRLRGPLFSEEFWTDYEAALSRKPIVEETTTLGERLTRAGSMNELIARYYQSSGFTSLAETTQRTYKSQLEEFRGEHGDLLVSGFKTMHVDAILGTMAAKSKSQAHKMRKRLLMLMQLAVAWKYRADNPMLTAQRVRHKEKGYRSWTEEDVAKFRAYWAPGSQPRIALEVLLNTGLRRSDAVKLGRQHRVGNRHILKLKKSGDTVQITIPINKTLEEHLAYCPTGHLAYLITQRNAPHSEKAFTNSFIRWAKEAGLPPNSSPHGLRKACCRRLTEAGCTAMEIMSITGQSLSVVERYIREFNKEAAADSAMGKLAGAFDR
jgi:integrase